MASNRSRTAPVGAGTDAKPPNAVTCRRRPGRRSPPCHRASAGNHPASSITPRPVRWLWPDRIPAGALTLLAGREGIGKSLVGVHLAAQLTRGELPGARFGTPSRVIFATSEDAWEFTMVPRLLAAGADLDMIGRVQVEDAGSMTGLTMPARPEPNRVHGREERCDDRARPADSVMDGRIDAHRDREVRTALEPLGRLAEETGAAVLGLVHLGKGLGTDPVNLILGAARSRRSPAWP